MMNAINLASLIAELGITQYALADQLGVTPSYISSVKNGGRPLPPKHEQKLIEIYGEDVCNKCRTKAINIDKQIKFQQNNKKFEGIGQVDGDVVFPCPEDDRRIHDLEKEVERLTATIAHKDDLIKAKDETIKSKDDTIESQRAMIASLQDLNRSLSERIAFLSDSHRK